MKAMKAVFLERKFPGADVEFDFDSREEKRREEKEKRREETKD